MLNPTPTIDNAASEVCLTGTFRAVNWITRTALLYDDDGNMTTVRFTPEQDNWLKLVVNIPVNLKGALGATATESSQNGQRASNADANGASDAEFLQLTEVKVIQRQWFPYDDAAYHEVLSNVPYDFDAPPRWDLGMSSDDFMRSIRGPDYDSNAE